MSGEVEKEPGRNNVDYENGYRGATKTGTELEVQIESEPELQSRGWVPYPLTVCEVALVSYNGALYLASTT